ncbi:MAG: hypothetical protein O2954_04640 [bacterium]|nr:hypothetical protein [bacterium]
MIERKLTVSQARNLLRILSEKNQGHLLRLGQEIPGPSSSVAMAPRNSRITYRILDYFREHGKEEDPRIRVLLYDSAEEIAGYIPEEDAPDEQTERTLERRAHKASRDVGQEARRVATTAQGIYQAVSGPKLSQEDLKKPDIKATLAELEKALRRFKQSTQVAIDEYIENRNPLVLELIRDYNLDVAAAKHGLRVASFATELASNLGSENYLGKIRPETLFERLDVPEDDRNYNPETLSALRQNLFKRELVEIFMGGFLHDAGLWSSGLLPGHEERGASIVAHIPQIQEISHSLIDIVLFHSDLEYLASRGGILRAVEEVDGQTEYRREYYSTAEAAGESLMVRPDHPKNRLIELEDLRKIFPIALAEFVITSQEDSEPPPMDKLVFSAVSLGAHSLYVKFLVVLCNSQPKVIVPIRALVTFDGRISAGGLGKKHLMDLDGDIGICIHDQGWPAPHVIRIFRKRPDGSLENLAPIAPDHPALIERARPGGYMYVPVGRQGNLSVTVIGIMGEEAFEKNFRRYADRVQQLQP